jgi:hypothetical protein
MTSFGSAAGAPGGLLRIELGQLNDTPMLKYAESGRRPTENPFIGTDHGTSSVNLALSPSRDPTPQAAFASHAARNSCQCG